MKPSVRDVDARTAACIAAARVRTITRVKESKPERPTFGKIIIGGYFLCEQGIVNIKTYPTGATQVLTGLYYPFDDKEEIRPIKSLELIVNL